MRFCFYYFILCYYYCTLPLLLSSAVQYRRVLHQPFFPLDSQPPNSPSSTLSPPLTPPGSPFFPTYPSSPPPPPPPTSLASFPANVSSLNLPHDSKSKNVSSKLAVTAIAAVLAAAIVVSVAVCLHFRKKRNRDLTDAKTQISDNSSRINYPSPGPGQGQGNIPKLQRPSQTSSEFLYLGTLVDSYGGIGTNGSINHHRQNPTADTTAPNSRKMDSPDLRPLPPLKQQNIRGVNGNGEFGSGGHDEIDDEVFYSPRGSLGGRESSNGVGSASTKAFSAVELEKFGSSSSYSSSSSASGSPVRSVSQSISPPVSLSPKEFRKSPELVGIQAPPSRPPPPPPPPPVSFFRGPLVERREYQSPSLSPSLSPSPPPPVSFFRMPLVERKESQSPSLSPSLSPSPPSSTSPERVYSRSRDPSPTISSCSNANLDTPQLISSPSRRHVPPIPPPPPPPLPPPFPPLSVRNSLSPRTPTPQARRLVPELPVLVAPRRPMSVESPSIVPIQLPSSLKGDEKNEKAHASEADSDDNEELLKPKLKALHWDKVRASSGREMVWDQLKSSSFKLNEEMIETLFVAKAPVQAPKEATRWQVLPLPTQENRVLDPKKSQNIAILLRALNVTVDEVCDSLLEGSADNIGTELLESLLKMAPSKEEECKLKEYKDDSPIKLGPAEKFLKAVLDIPFAFKRVEALLYISNFESEIEYLKNSFQTLETACEELRNSRMFLKLLEAVLKTGNRMNVGTNRGDAHAFKLDTLLKLADIKGADGKTTLLHFVVQEMIRSEGARLHIEKQNAGSFVNDVKCRKLGLQVVSGLLSELSNVKKAAAMDSEVLHSDVLKLSNGLESIADILRLVETKEENSKFSESVSKFVKSAEEEIIRTRAQESVALTLVKEITEYFHGNSAKEEAHPFRIFMVVRDFLAVLDRVCKEVGSINERMTISTAHKFPIPVNPTFHQASIGFPGRRPSSSSDDESS